MFRFIPGDNRAVRRIDARVLLAPFILLACLAVPGAATAAVSVDPDTGRIAIRGLGNGPLREAANAGDGPGGRVGFLAGGSWHHATELLRSRPTGDRRRLVLASDDPDGYSAHAPDNDILPLGRLAVAALVRPVRTSAWTQR